MTNRRGTAQGERFDGGTRRAVQCRLRRIGRRGGLLLLAALALSISRAQGSWELPVCVDPNDPPASSQSTGGYEEEIAHIIANALGAKLKLVWAPRNQRAVREDLYPGRCDAVMGAPETSGAMLNSVPYYRAAFVFVWRAGKARSISSFSDPVLKGLRIAVPPNALAYTALLEAGLSAKAVRIGRDYASGGGAPSVAPLLNAVRDGRVDTAIVFGPYAASYVRDKAYNLQITPAPEITAGGLSMFRTATIGVRPGDKALSRQINIALAERWDAIQGVLTAAGVPMFSVSRPVKSPTAKPPPLQIGVVLPTPTSLPAATDTAAREAEAGAQIGASDAGTALSNASHRDLYLREASSPNAAAAQRAARRLVATDHVSALVGGLGEGQASVLSQVAAQAHVPFINIGSEAGNLRTTCRPYTFSVAPSAAMYLDGMAQWSIAQGAKKWFIIYQQSPAGRLLLERAKTALRKAGQSDAVVGSASVPQASSVFYDVIDKLERAGPAVVVLLLPFPQEERFLAELPQQGLGARVTGLLPTYGQDRSYLVRLRQDNRNAATKGYWLVAWDPALHTQASKDFNETYGASTGNASDAAAWATYAAIGIVVQASIRTTSIEPVVLARYLAHKGSTFDVSKGMPLPFRAWSHQLSQPLYVIRIRSAAPWGPDPAAQTALAKVVGTVPSAKVNAATSALDGLGDGPASAACR